MRPGSWTWPKVLRPDWGWLSPRLRGGPASCDPGATFAGEEPGADAEELDRCLQRLRVLTRTWAGEPLGGSGLLRVIHAEGARPPLLWCYNGQDEFGRMAAGLGPEQPVVGMRSLNKAAPAGAARLPLARALADRYAEHLIAGLAFDRCAVGGNCQSAAIATRIAEQLRRAGKRVDLLLTLDATPPEPVPGRVAMLFGRDSEAFNPFLWTERPEQVWRAIHGEPSWTIVPGAHGEYFSDANLGPLCEAVAQHLAASREARAPDPPRAARLTIHRAPRRARAGSELVLRVQVKAPRGGHPFAVCGLWSSRAEGAWSQPWGDARAVQPIAAGRAADLAVPTPDRPGTWSLRLALCQEGVGPVGGGRDPDPRLSVELEGAAVPA